MKEKIKRDILDILNRVIEIIKKGEIKDIVNIKELSNHTIHNSSVFQDKDSVSIAVIVYALSKIIDREKGLVPKPIIKDVIKARSFLEKNLFKEYRNVIKNLFKDISKIDRKLKLYIEEVIEQGAVKKGSKLYAHGISMAQAANILGISQWELMNYVGKTKIIDVAQKRSDVKQRIEFARGLFK